MMPTDLKWKLNAYKTHPLKFSSEFSLLKVANICEFNGHFVWISLFKQAAQPQPAYHFRWPWPRPNAIYHTAVHVLFPVSGLEIG